VANLDYHPKLSVLHGDIKDFPRLSAHMVGADTVFHLAANPDIARAVTEPDIDFREGTQLTQNILEAARINGVKLLVYTSGSGVYGENADVAFREDYGPMMPISTYGASKLASEAMICAYCNMFGLTARAFRFANVVGRNQTHGVGLDFCRQLLRDPTRLRILGDGTQTKSYIHIDDVLNAVLLVVTWATGGYDVYNVATDDYVSVTTIAGCASHTISGQKAVFEYTGGDRGWKGDVPTVRFNCEKIKKLGWRSTQSAHGAICLSLAQIKSRLCTS
jgi:UDP-glucose 4-epimerase